MAKNGSKKNKKNVKKNGGSVKAHTDTFSDEAESESMETAETPVEDVQPMNEEEVRRLFPLVLEAEAGVEDAKKQVDVERMKASELIVQLRAALGSSGPHRINGRKFHIRSRGDFTFIAREDERALNDIQIEL